jgi:hypothetical protein
MSGQRISLDTDNTNIYRLRYATRVRDMLKNVMLSRRSPACLAAQQARRRSILIMRFLDPSVAKKRASRVTLKCIFHIPN